MAMIFLIFPNHKLPRLIVYNKILYAGFSKKCFVQKVCNWFSIVIEYGLILSFGKTFYLSHTYTYISLL